MIDNLTQFLGKIHRVRPVAEPVVAPVLDPPPRPKTSRRRAGVPSPGCRFYVPFAVVEATAEVMRRFGRERRECYVWWGGYTLADGSAQVLTAIHPEIATEYGHIHLGQRALGALQAQLLDLDQVLLVELHTHPPMAGGQNEVDAAHPAAPYAGFISIVVPDFGFANLADLRNCHVYEYVAANRWRTLPSREIADHVVIDSTNLRVTPL